MLGVPLLREGACWNGAGKAGCPAGNMA